MKKRYSFVTVIVLLILTACGGDLSEELASPVPDLSVPGVEQGVDTKLATSDVLVEAGAEMGVGSEADPEAAEQPVEGISDSDGLTLTTDDRPAWQRLPLTDARTGESFMLADFDGQTVFVEPMATWCSNCRRQLNNVREATLEFEGENVVFIGLSVETNIDDASLAQYADGEAFDWIFAVATPDLLKELAEEFGRSVANPPATPHFIILPNGSHTDLVTGIEPAGQIVAQIKAAQG